ncbi:Eco57I restriction-modification methylase domain-containing protein [Thermoflexibacter ruber]|uniref:site-specific DNA-methyltransferase (adenine-specific) n=1 Tax=Thermoflexibacter ruber TaxID=1003 RepID=A0A1I2II03_9BACT|nr:TaqI-like C-terminal specificity domain-containing protein [Thermoflexibacter ruber]SFF41844.1 Type II restriction/modification system, DNA methylase subunit YeeA [Thermoflexibacter ruber]
MAQEQIHQLFKQGYNQTLWKQFLAQTFSNAQLLATPQTLSGIDNKVASNALKLGYISLDENGIERKIAVYEVELAQAVHLERNRVGLRNLLRRYWIEIDAAFIVFHSPATQKWRFSYVSELTGFDAEGNFQKIQTEPKRYTYVLGEGESTRTAAERFALIAKKASKASLDDVKEAFSVEKLSKAFFDQYKKHYDIFCDFMMKKPSIKASIFNGDEKAIRDFNKKLLGRIVFLYFIQKKGWLGVPVGSKWGQGDFNFLTNLFHQYPNPDLFYSEMLTRLFFDTLNTKRKDDIMELLKGQACRIPYLNGGLFEENDKKHRNIIIEGKLFENLFNFFNQYNFTIYEDDPNDHTVAVDPEMLGHIFENLLEDNKDKGAFYTPKEIVHYMCQESLIEYLTTWFENKGYEVTGYIGFDKPKQPRLFSANEGRKGQMLLEVAPQSKGKQIDRWLIEKLLKKKLDENDKKLIQQHATEFHKALDQVKICDPAIGSGAFPMGLLQEICTAKQTLWHFQYDHLKEFPASEVKLNIIQNSIYGVDIEKGAVDIARLRFWLSLVVDEEAPKPLPNLDYKIVVGNSLVSKLGDDIIDIDWEIEENKGFQTNIYGSGDLQANKAKLLKKISEQQKEFFSPDSDKKKLAAHIRNLKIDLLINQLELMAATKGTEDKPNGSGKKLTEQTEMYLQTLSWKESIKQLKKLKDQPDKPLNFFDWKLDFPEVLNELINPNPGFDIVIGNPPYVQLQKDGGKLAKMFEKQNYDTFARTGDIYALFYEKGIHLLKNNGILCYITSNKWMRAGYGEKLRKFFIQHSPKLLIDLGPGVFESATVDTNILLVQKQKPAQIQLQAVTLQKQANVSIEEQLRKNGTILQKLTQDAWFIGSNAEQQLKEKIERIGKPLKEWDVNIYYGIKTGLNEAFIITTEKRNEILANCQTEAERTRTEAIIKPILRGRDIKRYSYEWANLWVIGTFPALRLDIEQFPALKKYFLDNFDIRQLEQSGKKYPELGFDARKKTGNKWFETQDQIAYYQEFEKEKVVWSEIVRQPQFFFDKEKFYVEATSFLMTGDNVKYLCGLLNSKPVTYFFKQWYAGGGLGEEGYRYKKAFLENLPIPPITESNLGIVKQIEALVEKILQTKRQNSQANTRAYEQEIDRLVYQLYALSYEEVKTIDPAFPLSKEEYGYQNFWREAL